jgi:prepilin-type N-terminal cleavage/methylation domain-containing protein
MPSRLNPRVMRGFTLVEILVAFGVFGILSLFLFRFFSETQQIARRGVCKAETVAEAHRVLRRIHKDLKLVSYFDAENSGGERVVDDFFRSDQTSDTKEYQFYLFPTTGPVEQHLSKESRDEGDGLSREFLRCQLNRVSYKLENIPGSSLKKLLRQEGEGGLYSELSNRVVFFQIEMKPSPEKVLHKCFWYFRVVLQLIDAQDAQRVQIPKFTSILEAKHWAQEQPRSVSIADFFDVVFPEPLTRELQNLYENGVFQEKTGGPLFTEGNTNGG